MKKLLTVLAAAVCLGAAAETSVTQYGVTWTFDKDCKVGKFVNGDYYVVGPVNIVSITNDINTAGFTPKQGQNGSMINPKGGKKQGYEVTHVSYDASLNAALPGGKEISKTNPLQLKPGQSLISGVSWLWNSPSQREPGMPQWSDREMTARPFLRAASVLTCLDKVPPEGSFRPGYCGDDKTVKYNIKDLQTGKLKTLAPVTPLAEYKKLEDQTLRPWLDHLSDWIANYLHPTNNMPPYGRELCTVWMEALLMLNLDYNKIPGKPTKDKLLINMVQIGIDLTSAADSGTYWPANGGHCAGRKPVILFAGIMLNDKHMLDVGNWKTRFQDNDQTFYVTEKDVAMSNSPKWKPDPRAVHVRYTAKDIGMPDWCINYYPKPWTMNAHWSATYRAINNTYIPSFALFGWIMDAKELWKHDAYFDYADRVISVESDGLAKPNKPNAFAMAMWNTYRKDYPASKWLTYKVPDELVKGLNEKRPKKTAEKKTADKKEKADKKAKK